MKTFLIWLKANPVAVTDALKVIISVLSAVGVPITSGVSAAVGGALIVLLSIYTQYAIGGHVDAAVADATADTVKVPGIDAETVSEDAGTPVEAADPEPLSD